MNKNMVVRILGKKAHHFTAISMTIMLVSLISTGFLFSYLIHQYMSINRDFFENQNVKVIHISGRSEQDYFKTLELKDVQEINALINDNGLGEFAQAYPIYVLPTIFNQETGEGLSTTAIDEAIAFLISDYCMLNDQTICLPEADSDSMMIGVPIIEEQEGGYSSNEIVSLSYKTEQGATRENAVIIQNAPQVNQTYVNEKTALDLLELMYGSSQNSFEYILETHLDKIIVYVNSVKDVDQIGELLTSNNYYSSYTFNSFEHFSTNITNLQIVLIILSIVFILIAIMTSVLLVINFIRIQKKEISILKLIRYTDKHIKSIYLKLIIRMFSKVLLITLITLLISYLSRLIPIGFVQFIFIIGVIMFMVLVTIIIIYFFSIEKIAEINLITLLKKNKEFE